MARKRLDPNQIGSIDHGSDGSGWMWARAAALGRRSRAPAAEQRRSWPNRPLRGSVHPAVWPWVEYAACVVHLGGYLGSGRLRAAHAWAAAALRVVAAGERRSCRAGAGWCVQKDRGAHARHTHPETRSEQSWKARQGIRHGGAGQVRRRERRRVVPGHLGCATGGIN